MFDLESRSYGGKIFRPTPEIEIDTDMGLAIIATPWGAPEAAQRVIQIMKTYILSFREDADITSPFPRMTCLSAALNTLRVAAMLANDSLYREENKKEYIAGVEIFAITYGQKEVGWLQLGHPNLFLSRAKSGLMPLGSHMDLPIDLSRGGELLSPLPSTLLGLNASANFIMGSFIPQQGDQLILISRSHIPQTLFTLEKKDQSLTTISQHLARDNQETAFWLGILKTL